MPDEAQATFGCVFMMESGRAEAFPVALLMSLARLKYSALSNLDLGTDDDPGSGGKDEPNCEVALANLHFRGVITRSDQILHKSSIFCRCPTPCSTSRLSLG